LSLPFEGLSSLQVLVGGIVASAGLVWVVNVGVAVVVITEIRAIWGSSDVLHLLPTETFSVTGGGFAFASSTLSSDRPGVRILVARVTVAVG